MNRVVVEKPENRGVRSAFRLRDATADDAEAWSTVLTGSTPYLVTSGAAFRYDVATSTRTMARVVAEVDGEIVGICRLRDHIAESQNATVQIQVAPDHRRQGAGRALFDEALIRLDGSGARRLTGIVSGDGGSVAACTAWGFTLGRRYVFSAVDPRTVARAADAQMTLPLDSVDAALVWECWVATACDDPSGLSRSATYDEFMAGDWSDPLHRPDLGRAVMADGQVNAFALVQAAGGRGWNSFTGTRRDQRGRGLAGLVKSASLRALADAGVTLCSTGNAAANAPMLAVNNALGYRPIATAYGASRSLV